MTPPEWGDENRRANEQLLRMGRVTPWEKEYFRKDGSRVPVLVGGAVLESDGEETVFFVLDLSKLRHAEEQVREVNCGSTMPPA